MNFKALPKQSCKKFLISHLNFLINPLHYLIFMLQKWKEIENWILAESDINKARDQSKSVILFLFNQIWGTFSALFYKMMQFDPVTHTFKLDCHVRRQINLQKYSNNLISNKIKCDTVGTLTPVYIVWVQRMYVFDIQPKLSLYHVFTSSMRSNTEKLLLQKTQNSTE